MDHHHQQPPNLVFDGEDDPSLHPPPPPKRCATTPTRDRLSELPDLALVHILSQLYTHEAAQTSVLSKRFNSLWNSVDSLRFSDEHSGKRDAAFIAFVDAALALHRRNYILKCSLDFNYDHKFRKSVDQWLNFATQKQVKALHLNFNMIVNRTAPAGNNLGSRPYKLPKILCNNAQLEKLVTSCCEFKAKRHFNWSRLKLLTISKTRLNEDLISKILKGCSVLETLELQKWTGFDKVKIDSPSLRVLRIVSEQRPRYRTMPGYDCVLEISGPNLVLLEVSGILYRTRLLLTDVGSLIYAVMDFEIGWSSSKAKSLATSNQDIVTEVLESLCLVKDLTIGGFCIQVLSTCEAFQLSSPWSERRRLALHIPFVKWNSLGIASLLHSSPYMETLVIQLSYCSPMCVLEHSHTNESNAMEDVYWKLPMTVSRCPLRHVKKVRIMGFQVSCRSVKPLFNFLEFLLRNAKVLEDVTIQTTRYVTREALDEALKLFDLPTASPDAVVQFEPPHLWIDPFCMQQNPASG